MDKAIAKELMGHLLALSAPLNSATALTLQITEEDEQVQIRKGIAEIMNIVYADLMMPIIKQYADLNPDK